MAESIPPRSVVVTRPTELELLLRRHATLGQARFFLERHGLDIREVERRHSLFESALSRVLAAIPREWRRSRVDRDDLDRFGFAPGDLVVVLGQDGLVANVAKYLEGQLLIGLNPDPERYDGVLVPHSPARIEKLLLAAAAGRVEVEERTLVEALLDDGQRLLALNEIFVGHRSHQSARYRIAWRERSERHSSSGLIVTTGTGATGWARSICRERGCPPELPAPSEPALAFLVREAFPSVATGTALTQGVLSGEDQLEIVSEMGEGGVLFGDGIEKDAIELPYGSHLELRIAEQCLNLVR